MHASLSVQNWKFSSYFVLKFKFNIGFIHMQSVYFLKSCTSFKFIMDWRISLITFFSSQFPWREIKLPYKQGKFTIWSGCICSFNSQTRRSKQISLYPPWRDWREPRLNEWNLEIRMIGSKLIIVKTQKLLKSNLKSNQFDAPAVHFFTHHQKFTSMEL